MERTTSGSETVPGSVFEGWNIGAVSVQRVRLQVGGFVPMKPDGKVVRHVQLSSLRSEHNRRGLEMRVSGAYTGSEKDPWQSFFLARRSREHMAVSQSRGRCQTTSYVSRLPDQAFEV